jgi:hypothetical protein
MVQGKSIHNMAQAAGHEAVFLKLMAHNIDETCTVLDPVEWLYDNLTPEDQVRARESSPIQQCGLSEEYQLCAVGG